MSFQDNLRKYRERQGITAKELATQLGLKYTTYANYENQGKEPKYDTLCKIAAALHVTTDDLLGYKLDDVDYWISYLRNAGFYLEYIKEDNEIALYTGEKTSDGLTPYLPISEKTFLSTMDKLDKAADREFIEMKK